MNNFVERFILFPSLFIVHCSVFIFLSLKTPRTKEQANAITPEPIMNFDREHAVARLMEFLAVEGITGHEKAIGVTVEKSLRAVGVPGRWIKRDNANASIPLPTETGNLIVSFPGTLSGPRRLLSTHLDTVPLCAGAVPVRKGAKIVPQGKTALGGDNRTGVACLVTAAATLLES